MMVMIYIAQTEDNATSETEAESLNVIHAIQQMSVVIMILYSAFKHIVEMISKQHYI